MNNRNKRNLQIAVILFLAAATVLLIFSIIQYNRSKNIFQQNAGNISGKTISGDVSLNGMDYESHDSGNVNQSLNVLDGSYYHKKGIKLRKEGKYEESLKEFDKGLEVAPHKPGIWHGKAHTYLKMGKIDDALKCLDKSIEISPTARAWYLRGIILGFKADYQKSLEAFDRSLEIKPSVSAWFGKGNTLNDMERDDEALVCYEQALKLDKKAAAVWYYHGLLLDEMNRYEEAKVSFKKASALNYKKADEALEALRKKGL